MKLGNKPIKELLVENVLYIILIGIIVIITIMRPNFFSAAVAKDILMQSSVRILVALGCMFIIIAGSADLSGGRMLGFAALVSASLAQRGDFANKFWPNLAEMPIIVPIVAAIFVGLMFGLFNGLVVSKLKVPAFLATLGAQMIIFGFSSLYFNMEPNSSQPLGGFTTSFKILGTKSFLGVPIIGIISIVCLFLVWILLNKTCIGKQMYATGGNLEAARVSGINITKITLITFGIAGGFYGLAGCLEAARTSCATSSYGLAYELDAIASCIVGGCSIKGGVGTVQGVFVGVIIFNVISYGLTFVGIDPYWQNIVKGSIIIAAVAIDVRKYSLSKSN